MKKQVLATVAVAATLACLGTQALAQSRDLNVVSWGGAYQDGQ
jgi:spermidine/putrescine-binding protein